jgi:hypothetical protein
MRFMALVKATPDSETGRFRPEDAEMFAAMGRFNEEMAKAGVLLAGEGLQPSSKGARVRFAPGKKPVVIDGPFAETKELIAGYWLLQVKSREEAIEWIRRSPSPVRPGQTGEIEIRQLYETSDFPAEVFPPEEATKEEALRRDLAKKAPKA